MNMDDLITKKKRGEALSCDEIAYWIGGYVAGTIPDYQVSALLMAICFRGMTAAETTSLTEIMAASGDHIDLSAIPGHKIHKHSTGGGGDKTAGRVQQDRCDEQRGQEVAPAGHGDPFELAIVAAA